VAVMTQLSAPAFQIKEQSMVIKRRRFKQTHSLQERLAEDTERLLEEVQVLPLGPDRSNIDRRITQKGRNSALRNAPIAADATGKIGARGG
jgi:hypothetical protein